MQSGGGPIDVEIANSGTAVLTFAAFEPSPDFAVTLGAPSLKIDPGARAIVKTTLTAANVPSNALQAALKPVLTQTLCGLPPVLTLKGRRVNSNVTLSSGDFGKQNCTPQAAPRDIAVSNYSASPLTYTASLVNGSKFTLVSGATGNIAPGTASTPTIANIRVQPQPFGSNLAVIQEDLMVNISGIAAPEGGPRKVPLKVDVRGAIVTITPQQLTGFFSTGNFFDTKSFTVDNTGNELIYLTWIFNRITGGAAWTYNTPSSVAAGATQTGTVGFKPIEQSGLHEARLTPARGTDFTGAGGVACNPLMPITLQGTKP
jgi:hypothetical protein